MHSFSASYKNLDSGNPKILAVRMNGLFYVREQTETVAATTESTLSDLEMWCQRLGHLNERDLKKLIAEEKVEGIKVYRDGTPLTCQTCLKGKLVSTSFPKGSAPSTKLLNIVHKDICGPMRKELMEGSRYFATFIIDCTG